MMITTSRGRCTAADVAATLKELRPKTRPKLVGLDVLIVTWQAEYGSPLGTPGIVSWNPSLDELLSLYT